DGPAEGLPHVNLPKARAVKGLGQKAARPCSCCARTPLYQTRARARQIQGGCCSPTGTGATSAPPTWAAPTVEDGGLPVAGPALAIPLNGAPAVDDGGRGWPSRRAAVALGLSRAVAVDQPHPGRGSSVGRRPGGMGPLVAPGGGGPR